MKKIKKMQSDKWLLKGFYSVKKMEILYQEKIEKALEANGIDECWWKCFERGDADGYIFLRLFEMYQNKEGDDFMVDMFDYYNRIRDKVNDYIEIKVAQS